MNFGTNINLQIVEQKDPAQSEEVVVQQNQACATKPKTDDNFFCIFICIILLVALCVAFIKKSLCKSNLSSENKNTDSVWSRCE